MEKCFMCDGKGTYEIELLDTGDKTTVVCHKCNGTGIETEKKEDD